MKNKLCKIALSFGICYSLSTSAFALNNNDLISSPVIPEEFEPKATLEYLGYNLWKTVDFPTNIKEIEETYDNQNDDTTCDIQKPDIDMSEYTSERLQNMTLEQENEFVDKIHQISENLPVYIAVNPSPEKGMCVKYDSWGNVESIYTKNDDGSYSPVPTNFIKQENLPKYILNQILENMFNVSIE